MPQAPIGIMTAMAEEMEALAPLLDQPVETARGGVRLVSATLAGQRVEIAQCGIGKVNAAIAAMLLIAEKGVAGLIFTGCAGGMDPALAIGDVVLASRVIQHDYGCLTDLAFTRYQPGALPLPGLPTEHGWDVPDALISRAMALLADTPLTPVPADLSPDHATHAPRLVTGGVLTGDIFLNCAKTRDRLAAETQAKAIEMEGAAMAQVAQNFGTPWLILRALSDLAGAESNLNFPAFARHAAGNAATVTRALVAGRVFNL